jgi:glycosyltransferase involved in cell wall biosynthesis
LIDDGVIATERGVTSVSAVFPCFNDVHTIGGLVDDVHEVLTPLVREIEVIVVDDGSVDGSGALLDRLAGERPWLRVVHHDGNKGYGQALISGFSAARYGWIFYTDGDAQYDARDAATLIPLVTPDVDIVQGYKIGRASVVSQLIGRVYHHVVK